MTLPESVRSLASDNLSLFVLANTNAAQSSKAGTAATTGTSCKGTTTYDSATGLLTATQCGSGTYSLRVVKPADSTTGGQVRARVYVNVNVNVNKLRLGFSNTMVPGIQKVH